MITVKYFGPFEGDTGKSVVCATVDAARRELHEWRKATTPPRGDGGGGWEPHLQVASTDVARAIPEAFEEGGEWWIEVGLSSGPYPLHIEARA